MDYVMYINVLKYSSYTGTISRVRSCFRKITLSRHLLQRGTGENNKVEWSTNTGMCCGFICMSGEFMYNTQKKVLCTSNLLIKFKSEKEWTENRYFWQSIGFLAYFFLYQTEKGWISHFCSANWLNLEFFVPNLFLALQSFLLNPNSVDLFLGKGWN